MAHTKIISLRLPEQLVKDVDAIAAKRYYMSRTSVIQHFLSAMLYCTVGMGKSTVLDCWDPVADGVEIVVSKKK